MQNIISQRLRVNAAFFLALAFATVALPLQWILCWFAAVALHEICHIITIIAMHGHIFSITLDTTGAVIETEKMHPFRELICALSGPLGAFIVLPFAQIFPRLCLCVCVQSFYNLLPLYPLDGGRALHNLIVYFLGERKATRWTILINNITVILLMVAVSVLTFKYNIGYELLIAATLLFIRTQKTNYSLQRQRTNSTIQ